MSTFISRIAPLTLSLALAVGPAYAGTFQQQVAAAPRGEVDVSNIAGSIIITGWDKPAVAVSADLSSDTQRVKVGGSNGHLRVCVTYGSDSCDSPSSGWFGHKGPVRLELHVPQASEVDVAGVSADITSRGVAGVQRLHTVSGNIDADLGSGDDDVRSVSGTIRLRGSGRDGTLNISTVSGDLSVQHVAGELEARTVNGTLDAELSPARRARLNTTSGTIDLRAQLAQGGSIVTETVSGDQQIHVAASGGYSYDVRTFSGDIHNCFGQQSEHSQYGPGNRLRGTRGAGGGEVRIKSLSGGITLCDK